MRQCLAKDPDERWQSAHDVKLQLSGSRGRLAGGRAGAGGGAAAQPRAAGVGRGRRAGSGRRGGARLDVVRAARPGRAARSAVRVRHPRHARTSTRPRISPDGRTWRSGDSTRGTTASGSGRWTPRGDTAGRHGGRGAPFLVAGQPLLAFFAGGTASSRRSRPPAAPPEIICEATIGFDGTWSAADQILYDGNADDPIRVVAAGGGTPRDVITKSPDGSQLIVGWPEFLPDGERFVYLESEPSGDSRHDAGRPRRHGAVAARGVRLAGPVRRSRATSCTSGRARWWRSRSTPAQVSSPANRGRSLTW